MKQDDQHSRKQVNNMFLTDKESLLAKGTKITRSVVLMLWSLLLAIWSKARGKMPSARRLPRPLAVRRVELTPALLPRSTILERRVSAIRPGCLRSCDVHTRLCDTLLYIHNHKVEVTKTLFTYTHVIAISSARVCQKPRLTPPKTLLLSVLVILLLLAS